MADLQRPTRLGPVHDSAADILRSLLAPTEQQAKEIDPRTLREKRGNER